MKNHYFDSDLFGDDGLMQRRANPFGWQQRPQRPRASQPMRQPKPVPGPTSYGGVNQRAMQEADAPRGYFDPQPTDSDIMGGEIDPEIAGGLEAANSDYFAPRSQVSADDQIMGGSIDQTTARMAEDPYFGKPYNEDKDPPGHQKLAATPEHVRGAIGEYADAVRAHRATYDQEMDAINKTKRGFFKSHAEFQAEQSQRIANAQAKFQGAVNAENAVLASRAPDAFGKRTPEEHEWVVADDGTAYDKKARTFTAVPGATLGKSAKGDIKYSEPYNDENGLGWVTKTGPGGVERVPYTQKVLGRASIGPTPPGAPPLSDSMFDQQVPAGSSKASIAEARNAAIAERSANHQTTLLTIAAMANGRQKTALTQRAISDAEGDLQRAISDKAKAAASGTEFSKPDLSTYDEAIENAKKRIRDYRAVAGDDAPTTSVAPPTGGGSGSDGPLAKVEKPAPAEGGEAILDAAPAGIKAKGYDKARGVYVGKGKDGKWVYWKG